MKILLVVVGALVAIVVVVVVIGAMLPKAHTATRSLRVGKSPQDAYALARDFAAASSWRPDVQRVEMLDPVEGRVRFREHAKHGVVTYEVMEDVPAQRLVTRIVDLDLGYSGKWTYSFAPDGNGTMVSITEDGEVSNVLFRFLSRFVFGHTATMDAYLRAMAARLG